jgi:hypothetical protein
MAEDWQGHSDNRDSASADNVTDENRASDEEPGPSTDNRSAPAIDCTLSRDSNSHLFCELVYLVPLHCYRRISQNLLKLVYALLKTG